MIEQDLLERSTASLQSANIPTQGLSIQDQTATLTGPRGSLIVSEDARLRVAAVWGVAEVLVKPAGEPAPQPRVILSPQASRLEEDLGKLLEGKTVRFASSSAVILPDGRQLLDEIARILATAPGIPIEISGHTDSDGDAKKNLELSGRRAAAVKRYLASKGVTAGRLADAGYGSAKPIADNATPEGRTRNRRIEFHAQANMPGGTVSNQ